MNAAGEILQDLWHFLRYDIAAPVAGIAAMQGTALLSKLHIHPKKLQPLQLLLAVRKDNAAAAARLLQRDPQLVNYTLDCYAAMGPGTLEYSTFYGRGPDRWDLFETALYSNKPKVALLMAKAMPSVLTRNYNIEWGHDKKPQHKQPAMPLLHMLAYHDFSPEMACTAAAILIRAGADVNARDGRGAAALHHAGRRTHASLVELLMANGADMNARDTGGRTPLMYLQDGRGHGREIMAKFIANGADITAASAAGNNAAMAAVLNGAPQIAAALLEKGLAIDLDAPEVDRLMQEPAQAREVDWFEHCKAEGRDCPLPFNYVVRDMREAARQRQQALDEITQGTAAAISISRLKLKI